MVMIRDLGWDPSEDQKVEPLTKIQCHSCIGPPRVPSFPFAIMCQTYSKLQKRYPEKILSITSVEEGWSYEDVRERRAVLKVSRSLKHTVEAEEFHMLSCKSLICLYSKHFSYICNPATGELRRLTRINHERDGIGFGFDATENQYKLVLLHLTDVETSCDILTLCTNSWTRAINDDRAVPQYDAKASCPTTIRESIYWITTTVIRVLSFNVETRKFKLISSAMDPIDTKEVRRQKNIHYSLGEVLGNLCMVYHNGVDKCLWVWTLIEDAVHSDKEPQWCRRYLIDLKDLPAHTVPWHHVKLISVRGGRIILWSTLMGVVSYLEKARLFDNVLYEASGWWNQTVVYEKSSTPLDDILLLNSCIGPPRVPSFPFAILSQTYYYPEKTLSITSVEEGWNFKDLRGWKAELQVSIPLEGTAEEFFMLSCKSLICLYGVNYSYICNPTTREVRHLKKLHDRDGIGFGFDATKNQYKLVLLHLTKSLTCCDVLTLGTNSWSTARNDDPARINLLITMPVLNVLRFNVESRRFKMIRYHSIVDKKRLVEKNMHYSLGDIQGKLSMVRHNGVDKKLYISTLDEDEFLNEEPRFWIKYEVDLKDLPAHTLPGYHVTLVSVRGGRIILWSTWMGLVSYFEETTESERVDGDDVYEDHVHKFDAVLYTPSGCWNQAAVYEKSKTPLNDMLLLQEN
ncbi:hypothetical protein MKW92_032467 [Papaver armeniacum]|nr:hypothetical protein MKW92_032467 [Papaver armeniacum]